MNKANSRVLLVAMALLFSGSAVYSQGPVPAPPADVSTFVSDAPYALPWAPIMENEILWKKRVWRDIDTREKGNEVFTGKNVLAAILTEGFFKGAYKAYSAANDRFTTELTRNEFIALLTPGSQSAGRGFNPEQITKYRIKEDWLFMKKEQKMVVRILGIAPVREVVGTDGKTTDQPVFWVYYPEIRNFLAQKNIINNNSPYILNWDKLFEGRNFSSKIDKVSGEYIWSK